MFWSLDFRVSKTIGYSLNVKLKTCFAQSGFFVLKFKDNQFIRNSVEKIKQCFAQQYSEPLLITTIGWGSLQRNDFFPQKTAFEFCWIYASGYRMKTLWCVSFRLLHSQKNPAQLCGHWTDDTFCSSRNGNWFHDQWRTWWEKQLKIAIKKIRKIRSFAFAMPKA